MGCSRRIVGSSVDVFVVHVSTSQSKNPPTSFAANPQSSAIITTEAQGIKINGQSNTNIPSSSSSNPSSPIKANGFSPTSSMKTREKPNTPESSQTLIVKNLEPAPSGSESNAMKSKSSPPTKTTTKSKRRTVASKTSPSPSPMKVTVSRVTGDVLVGEKQDPKDESVQKPQMTSNKPSHTVSTIKNDSPVARQPNILALQANSLTPQLKR